MLWAALSRCLHWDVFVLVKIDASQSATEELTEFMLKRAFESMHTYYIQMLEEKGEWKERERENVPLKPLISRQWFIPVLFLRCA